MSGNSRSSKENIATHHQRATAVCCGRRFARMVGWAGGKISRYPYFSHDQNQTQTDTERDEGKGTRKDTKRKKHSCCGEGLGGRRLGGSPECQTNERRHTGEGSRARSNRCNDRRYIDEIVLRREVTRKIAKKAHTPWAEHPDRVTPSTACCACVCLL